MEETKITPENRSTTENNGVWMGAPSLGAYNFGLPTSLFLKLGGPLEESLQQLR